MSDVKRPEIKPAANGPLLVQGMEKIVRYIDGKIFEGGDSVAPCRCGGSKKKPYCDGTHAKNGFSSEKDPSHLADKRENFEGGGIEVHDNRGVCAHAGRCTEGLPNFLGSGKNRSSTLLPPARTRSLRRSRNARQAR